MQSKFQDEVAGIPQVAAAAGVEFVADATETVSLDVDGLVIPDERIVSRVTRAQFMAAQNFGSRLNGTLPIGRLMVNSGRRIKQRLLRSSPLQVGSGVTLDDKAIDVICRPLQY